MGPLNTASSWHIDGDTCMVWVDVGACMAKLPSGGCFVGICLYKAAFEGMT
jgi:hypothetical protein